MVVNFYKNKIGFPRITRLEDGMEDLPGIGEKITLNIPGYQANHFEVTEVKQNIKNGDIEIYVNTL